MHEIHVSVASAEAADFGVAELSATGESIGYTILEDGDLMFHIEPRRTTGRLSSARAASPRRSRKPATCSNSTDAPSDATERVRPASTPTHVVTDWVVRHHDLEGSRREGCRSRCVIVRRNRNRASQLPGLVGELVD